MLSFSTLLAFVASVLALCHCNAGKMRLPAQPLIRQHFLRRHVRVAALWKSHADAAIGCSLVRHGIFVQELFKCCEVLSTWVSDLILVLSAVVIPHGSFLLAKPLKGFHLLDQVFFFVMVRRVQVLGNTSSSNIQEIRDFPLVMASRISPPICTNVAELIPGFCKLVGLAATLFDQLNNGIILEFSAIVVPLQEIRHEFRTLALWIPNRIAFVVATTLPPIIHAPVFPLQFLDLPHIDCESSFSLIQR